MVHDEPIHESSIDNNALKFNNILEEFPDISKIFSTPGRPSASSRAIINQAFIKWGGDNPRMTIKAFIPKLRAFVQGSKKGKKLKDKPKTASKKAHVENSLHQADSGSSCNITDTPLIEKEIIKEEHCDGRRVVIQTNNNFQDSMLEYLDSGDSELISDAGTDVILQSKLDMTTPQPLKINSVRSLCVPQRLCSPHFNVSSLPSYYSEDEDDAMTLAKGYVIKLRKLSGDQLILADKLINETLVNAQFGQLTRNSSINK